MGIMRRDSGHIISIETANREGDGTEIDRLILRDGTYLELTCRGLRHWWCEREALEGFPPLQEVRFTAYSERVEFLRNHEYTHQRREVKGGDN